MNNQNIRTLTDWFFNLSLETKLNIYNKYKNNNCDFMHIFIKSTNTGTYTDPYSTGTDSQTGGTP